MHGTGVPLVTPFDGSGELDEDRLAELVEWVEAGGVDFVVPCGSTSEAELMSVAERARVVEVVVETATVPVLAGTGHPGYRETVRQTGLAAGAGADAALVVTPFYFDHDQATLAAYYRELAAAVDLPVYCYSVPPLTGVHLEPETVGELADEPTVHGLKDSSGDLARLGRERARVDDTFEVFVGIGAVYAHALDAGADGGILALANVAPGAASEVYERHTAGDRAGAHAVNRRVAALDHATSATHGVPGLKAAMRLRGATAGYARRPFRAVDDEAEAELGSLLDDAGL